MPPGAAVERLSDDLALISLPICEAVLPASLTDAEADVATRVFEGQSNAEIALARGVSPRTVSKQLEGIYRKLGIVSRSELVLALRPPVASDGADGGG